MHMPGSQTMRRAVRVATFQAYTVLMAGAAFAVGPPGIKLDGTLGSSAAVLAGPKYNISQSMGRLAGSNLFYSFQYFNVATGETALFSLTSPGINNVISRVTGGYASTIDGTISLVAPSGAPNFFLINPSGVTFTANARVNVPAAFYVTTANYLKFADGNFYADPSKTSTLSMASPEAFGFLGSTRAPVDVLGATLTAGASGEAPFEIIAGDVTINGGVIANTTGGIGVIGVGAQAMEVPLAGTGSTASGSVAIEGGGALNTDGGGSASGPIYVSAGSLTLSDGSAILSTTSGSGSAGAGDVIVTAGALNVTGAGSSAFTGIFSGTSGNASANAGRVSVTAGTLNLDGGAGTGFTGIESLAEGAAKGGSIAVSVNGASEISNGAVLASSTFGSGNGGDVR